MTRRPPSLFRQLLRWWPRYRVAPPLANPGYLSVYLADLNTPNWGRPSVKEGLRVTLWDEGWRR